MLTSLIQKPLLKFRCFKWNWCEEQVRYLTYFIKKKPQDFILSNGKPYTAKKMLNFAFKYFVRF